MTATVRQLIPFGILLAFFSSCSKDARVGSNTSNTSNTSDTCTVNPPPPPHSVPQASLFLNGDSNHIGHLSIPRAGMVSAVCGGKFFFANYGDSTIEIFDPVTLSVTQANLSVRRGEVIMAATANKVFFAGGLVPSLSTSSRVDIYDVIADKWTTDELSVARRNMVAAVVGNKVFFAGGVTDSGMCSTRVDIFDVTSNSWSTAELSAARANPGFAAAVVDGKVLFAGGAVTAYPPTSYTTSPVHVAMWYTTRVDIYDTNSNTWATAELSSQKLTIHAVAVGSKILFVGSGILFNDLDIYDATADSWSAAAGLDIGGVTPIVLNNKAYFAGTTPTACGLASSVYVFDSQTNSWSSFNLSEGRRYIALGISNNKIAFIGGLINDPNPVPGRIPCSFKTEIFNPSTNSLSILSLTIDLAFESVISFNNYIYTFGGNINAYRDVISDIYRFWL